MNAILAIVVILCVSCAQTTIYHDGRRVANFQGDMTGMRFIRNADGSCELSGDFDHSTATKAQGEAAAGKLAAAGTAVATAGIMTLIQ